MLDHRVDGGVAKVDILFFEGCECVAVYAVEDELLPGFLHAEVLGVKRTRQISYCYKRSLEL